MTDIEKSKLAMYEAVLLFMSSNRTIAVNIRAFVWAIIKFRKIVEVIKTKEQELLSETLFMSVKVTKARDELISTLLPISAVLFNLARKTNNQELKQRSKLTQSYLIHCLDCELLDKAISTEIMAHKHLGKLKNNGISPIELNELRLKTDCFKNVLSDKIFSYISSETVLSISNLFADADKILCSFIDNFVEALASEYPDFHEEYLYIRNCGQYKEENDAFMQLEEE
jgi:hypothetical protein